ncbi:MAG: type II secretion system protein GspG [Kiritimatiellia bacterium]|jgi:hypothetical protein
MPYRCPYCQADLAERPPKGLCPACGRTMLLPPDPAKQEARLARRRAFERIHREADRLRMDIGATPDARGVHSPRILLLVLAGMAVLGGSLVAASRRAAARIRPEPHLRAVHELDALATALGRFHFHVGRYPRTDEGGLLALVRDDLWLGGEKNPLDSEGTPRIAGWIGPYVNRIRPDPWGTPYAYELPAPESVPPAPEASGDRPEDAPRMRPTLFSCGPDKRAGTEDDLFPDPAAFDVGTDWTNGWVSGPARLPGVWIDSHGGVYPVEDPATFLGDASPGSADGAGEGGAP